MKKSILKKSLLLLVTFSLILFQGCSEEGLIIENSEIIQVENQTALKDSPVVDKLIEMGYRRDIIRELDNFYLVGECFMFSKDIKDYIDDKGLARRHASSSNLVSYSNKTITVYVDQSIPISGVDNWRNEVSLAINDWNNISGCFINFELSTNLNSDIIIKSDNSQLPDNVIASAGFPSNLQPYSNILLNLDFWTNLTVSESLKRRNIVHELGHCIGFRHTNWDSRGESALPIGANLIPGTPSQDAYSVMNGGTALNSWIGFSIYDIIASEYLYPIRPFIVSIIGSPFAYSNEQFTLTTLLNDKGTAPFTYNWYESFDSGLTYPYHRGSNSSLTLTMFPNDYQDRYLKVVVTDSTGKIAEDTHLVENWGETGSIPPSGL